MGRRSIPISKPYFNEEDLKAIQIPVKSGWVSQGKFVLEFEKKFADITKSKYGLAVSSCTSALHIAVKAMNIRAGDEVIVPGFTWISTANAVEANGGKPVFCDINPDTFNIDCNKIEEKITSKTVGLLPVHLFGLCVDMNKIKKIASLNKLWIVEDCACAFNSYYKNIHAGNFGNISCFSFHPRKSITTGEGGMIITRHRKLYEKAKSLRNIGYSLKSPEYPFLLPDYDELGYNYRMTDIQASLGLSQLKKADKILKYKIKLAKNYNKLLKDFNLFKIPYEHKDYIHSYQSYVVLYNPDNLSTEELITNNNWKRYYRNRNFIMNFLDGDSIKTRPGTHSAAHTKLYSKKYGIKSTDLPCSFLAEKLSVSLPFYYGMTSEEQEIVVDKLIYYHKKLSL